MKAKLRTYLSACLIFVLCYEAIIQAQSQPGLAKEKPILVDSENARLAQFDKELEELRILLKIPGLSAAIVKDKKLIWAKGFGNSDNEKPTPATQETTYPIGEITRTFAATILMQLVEQGAVDLNEPLSKYAPSIKEDYAKVKHLITQTSETPPGDFYGNWISRFAFLSRIIEKASGKTFQELLAKKIFEPLEMSSAVPGIEAVRETSKLESVLGAKAIANYKEALSRLTKTYSLNEANQPALTTFSPEPLNATSGLISSVADLAKYAIALDDDSLLKKETREKVFRPTISNNGQELFVGLGWFVQKHQGIKLVWHYGQVDGAASSLLLKAPDKNLTFILLANSVASSEPFRFARSGDVMTSVFATAFMRIFVLGDPAKASIPTPNWELPQNQLVAQLANWEKQNKDYSYEYDVLSHALVYKWLGQPKRAAELFNLYYQRYSKSKF